MTESTRKKLIDTAIEMNRCGLNQGTAGNISIRYEEGMLITPAAMKYSCLEPDDIVFVHSDGNSTGRRRPSSEWRFHLDIYRNRQDARAVLHAHPANSSALACMHEPIPAFHYMVAVAGGRNIRCAPYATFGTQELSDHVVAALSGRKACLMANHGLLCLEQDLDAALALAIEVEQLAKTYLQCLSVGRAVILDDEEMTRVISKFKSYRES